MTCHACKQPILDGEDWFTGLTEGLVAHWRCQPAFEVEWAGRPQYRAAWLAGWKLARATFQRPRRIARKPVGQSALDLGRPDVHWPMLAELTLNPADVAGLEELSHAV
jgi:hypothetical protein